MMKVLIDTNIILDFVLERKPFYENSETILRLAHNKEIDAYISATTVTDIYYLTKRNKDSIEAKDFIKNLLSFINISDVNKEIVEKAIYSDIADFEDAIQIYSAVNLDLELIITRNEKDFKKSEIKVLSPDFFLKSF